MKNRILIIDDDLDLCEVLKESFEDEGYDVSHVQSGLTGQKELIRNTYDYLILDIKIPGLNGFDILGWLKDTGKKIRIIVLTGMPLRGEISEIDTPQNSHKMQLLEHADAVFNKPYNLDTLLTTLKSLADH
ncbi:MAG: response regulator [Spirochaetales bacterium]|nr:response regulator [Spirochaetales bacterium]